MLGTVMALYNEAGLGLVPFLYGRRTEEVLRRRISVLLAMALMLAVMGAPPAFAVPGNEALPP
jgi:hypothetical protein